MVGPTLPGLRILDAYAGSGALGLEALSRGAGAVTFIECDPEVLRVLRANVASLAVEERCRIVPGLVRDILARRELSGPFDLVFADPPYAEQAGESFLGALVGSGTLGRGARVVIERDHRTPPAAEGTGTLTLARSARYGRTCLDFYRA